ncbi:ROK family protein [Mycetocola sp. 2940]|uniref:ROK family protein n=1 Tax=Mycetocola sp. 2940 TaxID=3156452 RepID=UPI0033998A80
MITSNRLPVLALDIGGTKLAVAVVTDDAQCHGLLVEPTRRDEGPGPILDRLFAMGQAAIDTAGPVAGVGISCGGPLRRADGILTGPLHLPGWVDIPIVAMAEERFGVPATLENDATAAALGEYRYGAGRSTSTMVYLTLSTGIGGGAVIRGQLHRGAADNGGEFGHILVRSGGRRCLCGRLGCLEIYASGSSIAERAREAVAERGDTSSLAGIEDLRAEHVSAAAEAGDPLAVDLWTETTDLLASGITDLVNILEPDLVVLGGGVTRAGSLLLDPLRRDVLRDAMPPAAAAVRIEFAELGDVVCVVGAAASAFDFLDSLATASARESARA